MGRQVEDTTAPVARAYDAAVALAGEGALAELGTRMRRLFARRTGAFGPDDPWFEARSGAFWDDVVCSAGFHEAAGQHLAPADAPILKSFLRAHRGLFVVDEPGPGEDDGGASRLVDLWSGAELLVHAIDESQALALEHAEGAIDARVVATPEGTTLTVLPGAYHHPPEALEPVHAVLDAARDRGMKTCDVLDALLRMDHVFRASSRVKAAFAYRVESLLRA